MPCRKDPCELSKKYSCKNSVGTVLLLIILRAKNRSWDRHFIKKIANFLYKVDLHTILTPYRKFYWLEHTLELIFLENKIKPLNFHTQNMVAIIGRFITLSPFLAHTLLVYPFRKEGGDLSRISSRLPKFLWVHFIVIHTVYT